MNLSDHPDRHIHSKESSVNSDYFHKYSLHNRCLAGNPYLIQYNMLSFHSHKSNTYNNILNQMDTRFFLPVQEKHPLLLFPSKTVQRIKRFRFPSLHLSRQSSVLPPNHSPRHRSLYHQMDSGYRNHLLRKFPAPFLLQ